ncbi:MAG TPA: oligosaccharide flippase family protein [Steroidobacteraceae bacterium]|nr:oligosaccharide flippase family protein [Steroidobacteraceae bacterium]
MSTAFHRIRRLLQARTGLATVVQTGIATASVLAINVVTGIISARYLGAHGRGELAALLLAPQFLSFLFTFGLPASLIVKLRHRAADSGELMGAALLISLLAGVLAGTCGVVAAPWLLKQYDPDTLRFARLLMILVALGVTSAVLMAALQVANRFDAYNRLRLWQSVLTLFSLAALALSGHFTPFTGALAYVVPTLPFFVWNLWWVIREFRPKLRFLRPASASLLSYGWRVHVTDVGNALFGQLDKLILVTVLAPALFGVYVVVFNLSRLITTFANCTVPVLLPRSAGKSADEVLTLTARALAGTVVLTLVAFSGFLIFGGLALRWAYGPQFAAGYDVLVILSLEASLSSAASVLQQPYLVLHRPGTLAAFHVAALVLAGFLIYVLARLFQSEGAALGLLLATAVRYALTYAGFLRILGIAPPGLLPSRADLAGILSRARATLA